MDKLFTAAIETVTEPLIQELALAYEMQLKSITSKPGALIKSQVEAEMIPLKEWLLGYEELSHLEKGFKLLLSNSKGLEEALKQSADCLVLRKDEEEFPLVFDTMQEMFCLPDAVLDRWHEIGASFFQEGKLEEALEVFISLTTLNNKRFQPWLALGVVQQIREEYTEALRAFAIASLLHFANPLPHLYSAACYVCLNEKKLASETLAIALSKMTKEEKQLFQEEITAIQDEVL